MVVKAVQGPLIDQSHNASEAADRLMIGKTFPLVIRTLRVDSRQLRGHLFRACLAAVVLVTLISIQSNRFLLSAPGLNLFWWVTQFNYWFITFAAVSFFATAITEEKEERTLSLLKMAGVGAGSLLLGKWLPRLIAAGLLIAVQYPFTILSVTLGGVLWEQVSCAYLSLLAHLFLVGNIGLLASVVCGRTNSAVGVTVLALVLYHVLPWAVQDLLSSPPGAVVPVWFAALKEVADYSLMMVGRWQLLGIVATGFRPDFTFYFQVYGNIVLGAGLLLASWLLFEPCTRNEVEPRESIWARHFRFGLGIGRRPWPLAIFWKDFHYLVGGPLSVVARLVLYGGLITLVVAMISDWDMSRVSRRDAGGAAIGCSLVILWIEGAVIASRVFHFEVVGRTWSTLSMIPRPLGEIAYSKLAGATMGLLPGMICFLVGNFIAPEHMEDFLEMLAREREAPFVVYMLILQPILALHLAALASVTMIWAGWPGAIFIGGFIVFLFNFLFISCIASAFSGPKDISPLMVMMDGGVIVLLVIIHLWIGRRLATLRAE